MQAFGRFSPSPRLLLLLAASGLVFGGLAAPAVAQPPEPFPFRSPDEFFQRFFGGDRADRGADRGEDEAAIERIVVSPREEKQLGDRLAGEYIESLRKRGIEVTQEGVDAEYVRRLVEQVQPHMENARRYRKLRIYIADSEETDAFSFPGGTLVFFRGLIDYAGSEAALVGVVGHELSHLDHGHQLRELKRWKFAQQTFSGGPSFSPERFMRSGMLLMKSFMRPFRPEDESEADRDGATWAFREGYDPRAMADMFARMADRAPAAERVAPAFLRTHPYSEDRRRDVLKLHGELTRGKPRVDLYLGVENLRTRTPRLERRFAE